MDAAEIVLHLVAALAVFLLGLDILSSALEGYGTERLRPWLARASRTPVHGLVTGTIATALLDSSSAVIVILIALVQARVLAFPNALGLVLGANIGTTIGSQVIAFGAGDLAPVLLAVGVLGRMLLKPPLARTAASVLAGAGLVFYALELMDDSTRPLRDSAVFLSWMQSLENPVRGALVGGLVTLVIQSSSATVGIAIGLCGSGLLPLGGGVAVMLGAEIGTCADTLVASVGRSRAALRVGVFHLVFNVISVLLGILLVSQLTAAAIAISPEAGPGRQLANAHVLFNVAGALVAVFGVRWFARWLEILIPDRAAPAAEANVGVPI